MDIWAHRGAKIARPENTIPAFEEAIRQKADGILLNVQMTKDGYLVVCHDETLNRTTNGKGFIKHYNLFEIKQLDAGFWFDKKYKATKIPMIEDVVEIIKSTDVTLCIVLKEGTIFYPNIEQKLVDIIEKLGIEEQIIISSFDHYALRKIKEIAPKLKTGLIVSQNLMSVEDYTRINDVDVLHYNIKVLNEDIVKDCEKCGVELITHLVNDEFDYNKAVSLGIKTIVTDNPLRIKTIDLKNI